MANSIAMLAGVVSFRMYFRKFHIKNTLKIAVLVSVLFRIPQLLVVTNLYTEYWLILLDGVVESYSFQLIIMPLIVYTAKKCENGCEASLFAVMMSISNFSGIRRPVRRLLAKLLDVTEQNFNNLPVLLIICILCDFIIPMVAIRRMFYVSSNIIIIWNIRRSFR